jgi:hypothetical protein
MIQRQTILAIIIIAMALVLLMSFGGIAAAQTWQSLKHGAPFTAGAMLLLTDGRLGNCFDNA